MSKVTKANVEAAFKYLCQAMGKRIATSLAPAESQSRYCHKHKPSPR